VVVDGGRPPASELLPPELQPLAALQAISINQDHQFDYDMARLIDVIERRGVVRLKQKLPPAPRPPPPPPPPPPQRQFNRLLVALHHLASEVGLGLWGGMLGGVIGTAVAMLTYLIVVAGCLASERPLAPMPMTLPTWLRIAEPSPVNPPANAT